MRLRINLLLILIVALLFQGCSNESELPQESVSQRTTANNSTSPIETTETSTTSIYKVENNQPEFLFDAESSGQLSTDWRSDLLAELRINEQTLTRSTYAKNGVLAGLIRILTVLTPAMKY